jgi:hypothetical protein
VSNTNTTITNDNSSNSSLSSAKSSVTFGNAYIRQYERVLGGRPEVPMALNLGWEYIDQQPMLVDDFDRISAMDRISTPANSMHALQTSLQERFAILHYCHGFSLQELEDAEVARAREYHQGLLQQEGETPPAEKEKKKSGMLRKLFGRKRNKVMVMDKEVVDSDDS